MPASTLTSKGQLTLPKTIREQLGLRAGDRVEFRVTGNGQVVVEAATVDLRELRGALKTPGLRASVEEMEEAVRTAGTRRWSGWIPTSSSDTSSRTIPSRLRARWP